MHSRASAERSHSHAHSTATSISPRAGQTVGEQQAVHVSDTRCAAGRWCVLVDVTRCDWCCLLS